MNIITSIESDYERLERLYYSNVNINIGREFIYKWFKEIIDLL